MVQVDLGVRVLVLPVRRRRQHCYGISPPGLPRPVGVPLRRHRRARRGGAPRVERLYRSPASFLLRLRRAAEVRGFCSWATEQAGVLVGVWRLDLPRSFLGGGGRRRRWQIQGLQGLGRRYGRRTTANGFCYCDSNQSHGAKRPLQLAVELVFLGGGDGGGRRGNRLLVDREGSRDLGVIFFFLRVLRVVWLTQLPLYPLGMCLYSYVVMYIALN